MSACVADGQQVVGFECRPLLQMVIRWWALSVTVPYVSTTVGSKSYTRGLQPVFPLARPGSRGRPGPGGVRGQSLVGGLGGDAPLPKTNITIFKTLWRPLLAANNNINNCKWSPCTNIMIFPVMAELPMLFTACTQTKTKKSGTVYHSPFISSS